MVFELKDTQADVTLKRLEVTNAVHRRLVSLDFVLLCKLSAAYVTLVFGIRVNGSAFT